MTKNHQKIKSTVQQQEEEMLEIRVLFSPHFKFKQEILKLLTNTRREVGSSSSVSS